MRKGEGIEIRGFGSLTVRPYRPYEGRNPRTGEPVDVPAKRLPFFKVGKELRELVDSSRHLAITGDDDDDAEGHEDGGRESAEALVPAHAPRSERSGKR
jgi:integration host factor subunit beta